MCFSMPKTPPIPPTPKRDEGAALAQEARARAASAQGVKANIFTSPLGDSGFGGNVKGATLLGQSNGV